MGHWDRDLDSSDSDHDDVDREPDSTWADPLADGRKGKDQEDAESVSYTSESIRALILHTATDWKPTLTGRGRST